jgi:hypothetical protein
MDAISAVVSTRWTARVFGDANLGDRRRNARLIRIVEGVADRPAGTIAEVFDNPADLCGAYDFIENDAIDPEALMACMARDAARHAVEHPFVWVATDGTSQTVTDRGRAKGTGPLGTTRLKGRGDKLHDALVMDPAGVPLGLCAVIDWQRAQTPARRSHGRRDVDQKETRYWLQARDQARTRLREFAPDVVLHFLHDREADSWTVLWDAVTHQNKEFTTVRAHWDRRLVRPDPIDDADARTLRDALARTTIRGELELTMPARGGQSARTATLSVRACRVTLDLRDKRHETHHATSGGRECRSTFDSCCCRSGWREIRRSTRRRSRSHRHREGSSLPAPTCGGGARGWGLAVTVDVTKIQVHAAQSTEPC